MMGKTHIAVGAAAFSVVTPPPTDIKDFLFWGGQLIVTMIASVAADIDDPRTTAGKIILPFVPRWLRPTAFSILGMLLIWHGFQHSIPWVMACGFFFFGAAISKHRNSPTHSPVGLFFLCLLTYLYLPIMLIPVFTGYLTHLITDAITEGIPIMWPFPGWLRIPITETNSFMDRVVFRFGSIIVLGYQVLQMSFF
ncbi:metal-dependent hydrolase [Schinkia azotoformans]|uniref:metal-dependent hydrolase n=1 Tax=Schinkia azotoformans TaxID=1454 RepID=UPI002E220CCF|nr:metal-dependent hydrolase [Schinkia azotoformans]